MMPNSRAQAVYDDLWAEAQEWFEAGRVDVDPYLDDREHDDRRGLTLVLRPDEAAQMRIALRLEQVRGFAPDQYYYQPGELHVTLLSLISAASGFDLDAVPLDAYQAVFEDLFRGLAPFTIRYLRLLAAKDALFLAGTSDGDTINFLRDRVRAALDAAGLGASLDQRYPAVTAHTTILRFRSVPRDLPGLLAWLRDNQDRSLGVFVADRVDFVCNDWYMSQDEVKLLGSYPLGQR
jgi:2'-5' RNA ligase